MSPPLTNSTSPPSPRPLQRSRTASITQSLLDANPRPGVWVALGEGVGSAPSLAELRRNSTASSVQQQQQRRRSFAAATGRRESFGRKGSGFSSMSMRAGGNGSPVSVEAEGLGGLPAVVGGEKKAAVPVKEEIVDCEERSIGGGVDREAKDDEDERRDGVENHEKPGWLAVTKTGLLAFWNFFLTPLGFFMTIYMLNVVGWGAMLFFLLIPGATPAMCHPTCSDINSPRRIWIETDSQILNALFCVTGFGLIPWRFRDLYYLLRWRIAGSRKHLEKLAKVHEKWYRIPPITTTTPATAAAAARDNEDIEATSATSISTTTPPPGMTTTTNVKNLAPPTTAWKIDFVVWMYVWNTFFQCVLSGFMWGMNRYDRPSWSTGLFVALACIVAGSAGGVAWSETKKVKAVEGDGDSGVEIVKEVKEEERV